VCDPVTAIIVGVGGYMVHGAEQQRKAASQARTAVREQNDAAIAERANAEASAAQSAQARLATDQRRRRQAGGLLSQGAPSSDSPLAATDPQPVTRATPGRAQSLLARGSPANFYG
jgi:hypothetical protein